MADSQISDWVEVPPQGTNDWVEVPPQSIVPRKGQRIGPPGAPGVREQWAASQKLPPDQQPGARFGEPLTLGGVGDIRSGVEQMRQHGAPNKVGGAVNIARGLGKVITVPATAATMGLGPIAGPAAVVVGTGGALAGGGIGSGLTSLLTDDPNYQAAGGLIGGLLGGALAGWYTGKRIANASTKRAAITEAANTPQMQAHRIFTPGKNDTGFDADMIRAIPRVKQAEAILGRRIGGGDLGSSQADISASPAPGETPGLAPGSVARDAVNAAKLAKQGAYGRFQWAAGPHFQSVQPTDLIADEIEGLITPAMRADPSAETIAKVKNIENLASQYRGGSMTMEQAADNAATKNAELRAVYKTSDDALRAQMIALKDPIITQAEANGYRKMIYKPFQDDISNAKTPEELLAAQKRMQEAVEARKDYGALDAFQEYAEGKINPASRQGPPNLLSNVFQATKAAVQAKTGNIGAAHGTVASMSPSDIDSAIQSLFKSVPDQAPDEIIAHLPNRKALPSAPDKSGSIPITPQPGYEQLRPDQKMLEAPTNQIGVSGVTTPDLTGQAQQGARRMNAGPRQLPAATHPEMGGTGTIVPGNVAPRSPYSDTNGKPLNQNQLPPAPQPTMGGTGTIVPGNTSISPRGVYGKSQLPPVPPGQAPINVLPTGPGAIGPASTVPIRSTETPRPAGGITETTPSIDPTTGETVFEPEPKPKKPMARLFGEAIVNRQQA